VIAPGLRGAKDYLRVRAHIDFAQAFRHKRAASQRSSWALLAFLKQFRDEPAGASGAGRRSPALDGDEP
jgi:hypothetical protein